jgi:hypothetical protein
MVSPVISKSKNNEFQYSIMEEKNSFIFFMILMRDRIELLGISNNKHISPACGGEGLHHPFSCSDQRALPRLQLGGGLFLFIIMGLYSNYCHCRIFK